MFSELVRHNALGRPHPRQNLLPLVYAGDKGGRVQEQVSAQRAQRHPRPYEQDRRVNRPSRHHDDRSAHVHLMPSSRFRIGGNSLHPCHLFVSDYYTLRPTVRDNCSVSVLSVLQIRNRRGLFTIQRTPECAKRAERRITSTRVACQYAPPITQSLAAVAELRVVRVDHTFGLADE